MQRGKKEIWGKKWISARVTKKSETLVSCLCLQDKAAEVSWSQVEAGTALSPSWDVLPGAAAEESQAGEQERLVAKAQGLEAKMARNLGGLASSPTRLLPHITSVRTAAASPQTWAEMLVTKCASL